MNMTSHGVVDIKGCQHSKHISISVLQTERFPKWVKMMYMLEIRNTPLNFPAQITRNANKIIFCLKSTSLCIDVTVYRTRVLSVD